MNNTLRLFQNVSKNSGEHEVKNIVYKTKNHDIFKLSKFNRNIILKDSMLTECERGFISPIIVNEDMVVIDGQHRLEASKILDKPVEFVIVKGLGEKDIISMNTVQRPWTLVNYIESFANNGLEEYVKLLNLVKEKHLSSSATATIAGGYVEKSRALHERVKNGEFEFHNYKETVEFLRFYERYREQTGALKRTSLAYALFELYQLKKFDRDRMITKTIETDLLKEVAGKSVIETTRHLIMAYNSSLGKNSSRRIDFHISSVGQLVINEKKSSWARGSK